MRGNQSAAQWIFESFRDYLARPVLGESLALFRIFFGTIMLVKAIEYLNPLPGISVKNFLYHETSFNFTYPGLAWIQPFPEPLWTLTFVLMGLSALCVALGVFYRISAVALTLSYSYIFLSELAKYNNHYYLMCLFAFLLAVMPADRCFSISSWLKRTCEGGEGNKTVPFWTVFLLRAQLFIVYFYGGLAKIDADWITGIPMVGKGQELVQFLTPKLNLPEIEPIIAGRFICWTGLVYDLTIGFLLIFRRTRLLAFALTFIFHASNHFLFPIGLFPLMAFTTTLIFLEPDWPSRFGRWIRRPRIKKPDWKWSLAGIVAVPGAGVLLGWSDRKSGFITAPSSLRLKWVYYFVLVYLLIQVVVPFRHFFIPGDAKWTEEGQDFSWRMMLRAKDASYVIYHVKDSELMPPDESGRMSVDWAKWPEEKPKALFVPIDSNRFDWSHHQGLTTTFEPNAGLRAIYRLSENEDSTQVKKALSSQWISLFGRDVEVVETINFAEVFQAIEEHLNSVENSENYLYTLNRIKELAEKLGSSVGHVRENDLSSLSWEFEVLRKSSQSKEVVSQLKRLHPFLLQGASFPNERFLVVLDPELSVESSDPEKLTGGQEFLVWIDLGRLRPTEWKELPQWFTTFEDRQLKIIWNYSGDLNHIQRKRFTTSPWMIRQLGSHIADTWEDETGRRPEVNVVSFLMMNFRVPQPLIDPTIDLASSDYFLLKHNEWILPLNAEVGSATAPPPTRGDAR
ncbi:HTTM domain-containing protein [Verrucomicrobiales bacterium]|nr:HTTM domain-containing protein [Verrucomicrobiales bacterium]